MKRFYRNGKLEVTCVWIKGLKIRTIWHVENSLPFREADLVILENPPEWFGLPES